MIALKKLPDPSDLIRACTEVDEKLITVDHVYAMLRIYPAPDVMEGLAEEVKNMQDGEQWDKSEEYFIKLLNNRTIKQRL